MVDITIRGAGIFGLSIAWICVLRGARVKVIDPHGPASGASGGIVGALAPHVPENWNPKKAFQLDSLLMAGAFWSGVEGEGGVMSGYGRTGRLQPVADAGALALAEARAAGAQALWRDRAIWRVCDSAAMGDWCPTSPTARVIHDTLSARLHPRRACGALVAALRSRGVEVTAEGQDQGAVIHATGAAGLAELSERLARPVGAAVKGQAALLAHDAGAQVPQIFADAIHIIPHDDATTAIGSTSERLFDDPARTDAQLDEVIARARAALPVLARARVIERWAGLRPRSKSRAPMLGAHPVQAGHFIANGGFKIGFGMAPKIAEVMADLVLEGRDQIPDDFRVETCL